MGIYFQREIKKISRVKGKKAFAMGLRLLLENSYKELESDDVMGMFESNLTRWKNGPENFSKEMNNNFKIYLLIKNLEK